MPLSLARSGGRADLVIDRAPVNVLDGESLEELGRLVRGVDEQVLVLSGLRRAFSAGVSVAEHAPEPAAIETMLAAMRHALGALVDTPAVTIASISGACLGGGAEIAAACDLVLVSHDARIGFPEFGLACFPPGAAALLALRIGEARANEWILTGRVLSGREAARAGFAARSVAPSELESETTRLAERLSTTGAAALAAARDLLREERRRALAEVLPRAEAAYRRLAGDADLARAVEGFGKRKG